MSAGNSPLTKPPKYFRSVFLTIAAAVLAAAPPVASCATANTPRFLSAAEADPHRSTANYGESAANKKPEYGTVWGYVGGGDGDPISGALVVIKGTNRFATTNVDGYYVISPVPPGTFEMKASRIGYGDAKRTEVKIIAGRKTNVNFILGANSSIQDPTKGMIEGHVVDATGHPLKRAHVHILGKDASADTDANGSFSLGPLAPGFYSVRAEDTGYLFQTARVLVVAGEITPLQFVLWPDRGSVKSNL
jgi:hypothetical protein